MHAVTCYHGHALGCHFRCGIKSVAIRLKSNINYTSPQISPRLYYGLIFLPENQSLTHFSMEGITKAKVVSFVGQLALVVGGVWLGMYLWTYTNKSKTTPPASQPTA